MNKIEEIYIIILFILNSISFAIYASNKFVCNIFYEKYYQIDEKHPRSLRKNIVVLKELFFPLIIIFTILTESDLFDNFATSSVFVHLNFLSLQLLDYLLFYVLLSRVKLQRARQDTILESSVIKRDDLEVHLGWLVWFIFLIEFATVLFMFSTLHAHHIILCMMTFFPLYILLIIISFVYIFKEDESLLLNQIIFSCLNLLFCISAFFLIYITVEDDVASMNFLSGLIIWISSLIYLCFNHF